VIIFLTRLHPCIIAGTRLLCQFFNKCGRELIILFKILETKPDILLLHICQVTSARELFQQTAIVVTSNHIVRHRCQCSHLPPAVWITFGRHIYFLVPAQYRRCILQIGSFAGYLFVPGIQFRAILCNSHFTFVLLLENYSCCASSLSTLSIPSRVLKRWHNASSSSLSCTYTIMVPSNIPSCESILIERIFIFSSIDNTLVIFCI